jgi:hypothetical protein
MSPQPTEKRIFFMERQPRDNPGYVRSERKHPWSDEAKTLDFSALCGAITGSGRRQVERFVLR